MLNFIRAKKLNIFDQLKLEEYLLKNKKESFCLINEGTQSAIVLGASDKSEQLVNLNNAKKDNISLIKRFTGGGTVFVDQNTLFVTFIFSQEFLKIDLFPESIIGWAETFYKKILEKYNFQAKENDFVIDNKKIAGNALYIKKDRFLLHTSFLQDIEIDKMNGYLLMPIKTPAYRNNRSHLEFLMPLKNLFSKKFFVKKITDHLESIFKIKRYEYSKINLGSFTPKSKILTL